MTTKLEIIGPYTPEHDGPYAFSGEECLVHAVLGQRAFISRPESDLGFIVGVWDLKNARGVPAIREFWVNEYMDGNTSKLFTSKEQALYYSGGCGYKRTIYLREVLPGEDA